MPSLPDILAFVQTGGLVAVLVLLVYLLITRRLITKGELDAKNEDNKQLRAERDLAYARLDRLSDVLEATIKVKVPG